VEALEHDLEKGVTSSGRLVPGVISHRQSAEKGSGPAAERREVFEPPRISESVDDVRADGLLKQNDVGSHGLEHGGELGFVADAAVADVVAHHSQRARHSAVGRYVAAGGADR